ncbi:hypothetical protein J5N97_008350 [Dioscorea zingiberensis]|uniref:DUF7651 domain-containing protein n=1 Tax=Dioscorea zingiberensis TaxID=325984 RepID=A0A9D5CXG7_9LILI|nr:hypothetical protein J5N97_008350 [Dioscorea zingiberensis]
MPGLPLLACETTCSQSRTADHMCLQHSRHSAVYWLNRACVVTCLNEFGKRDQSVANFVIPEIKNLSADSRIGGLTLIFVSYDILLNDIGEPEVTSIVNHLLKDNVRLASCPTKLEGDCFWGKLQIESLCSSLEKCVSLSLGHRIEMLSTISMQTNILLPTLLDRGSCLSFQAHASDSMTSHQVQLSLCAQEIGARQRSLYDSYTYKDVPVSSLPHIMRITALQQTVSSFGKTDTASVLMQAIEYIRFLEEQVQLLSDPYMKLNGNIVCRNYYLTQLPGTTQDHLQIFNIEAKQKLNPIKCENMK